MTNKCNYTCNHDVPFLLLGNKRAIGFVNCLDILLDMEYMALLCYTRTHTRTRTCKYACTFTVLSFVSGINSHEFFSSILELITEKRLQYACFCWQPAPG